MTLCLEPEEGRQGPGDGERVPSPGGRRGLSHWWGWGPGDNTRAEPGAHGRGWGWPSEEADWPGRLQDIGIGAHTRERDDIGYLSSRKFHNGLCSTNT